MKPFCVSVFAVVLCLCGGAARAQERPVAFTGATVIPVSGPEIKDGVLVVHRGKVVAVGPKSTTRVPADAETVSAAGRVIMPGLVDSHSHIGSGSGADGSAPIQADVRLLDAVNVRHTSIQRAQAGGITTVNVMPGSGHLLSGQTLYLKLRDGRTVDDLLIRDAGGRYLYGIKMANGTNPCARARRPGPSRARAARARRSCASSSSRPGVPREGAARGLG